MTDSAYGTMYERVYVGLNVTTCEYFHMGEATIPQILLQWVAAKLSTLPIITAQMLKHA